MFEAFDTFDTEAVTSTSFLLTATMGDDDDEDNALNRRKTEIKTEQQSNP